VARLAAIAALTAALLGCNQFHDMTAPYMGTWKITSGEDTATCMSTTMPTPAPSPVTGNVFVMPGGGTLQLSGSDTNHGTCIWTLKVNFTNAQLISGPTCATTASTPEAMGAMIVPVDYVMTLTSVSTATVMSTFDWTILGDTCRHVQQETLMLMQMP
jgi:hypothetical protein